jgi:hypothetical protein
MDASVEASTVSSILPSVEFILAMNVNLKENLHRVMTCLARGNCCSEGCPRLNSVAGSDT